MRNIHRNLSYNHDHTYDHDDNYYNGHNSTPKRRHGHWGYTFGIAAMITLICIDEIRAAPVSRIIRARRRAAQRRRNLLQVNVAIIENEAHNAAQNARQEEHSALQVAQSGRPSRQFSPIQRQNVLPIQRQNVLPIQRQDVLPIQRQNVSPIQRQDVLPIQRQNVLPIQRQDVSPIQRQNVSPIQRQDVDENDLVRDSVNRPQPDDEYDFFKRMVTFIAQKGKSREERIAALDKVIQEGERIYRLPVSLVADFRAGGENADIELLKSVIKDQVYLANLKTLQTMVAQRGGDVSKKATLFYSRTLECAARIEKVIKVEWLQDRLHKSELDRLIKDRSCARDDLVLAENIMKLIPVIRTSVFSQLAQANYDPELKNQTRAVFRKALLCEGVPEVPAIISIRHTLHEDGTFPGEDAQW